MTILLIFSPETDRAVQAPPLVPQRQRSLSRSAFARFGALAALLLASLQLIQAQTFPITQGSINTCSGAFYDSGGPGASGYGNNENLTAVICSDTPGGSIFLQWVSAALSTAGPAPQDRIRIYDGNSTNAPLIGQYTGTQLQGLNIGASNLNTSGCLTVQFTSNSTGTGVFAANITCYAPCDRPTAVAAMSEAIPALVCLDEMIQFNGNGSTAAPGYFIAQYTWTFGDGTTANGPTASHSFSEPGEYVVQLNVIDNNNCVNTNSVDLQVLVGTVPSFQGTVESITTCLGATVDLTGEVAGTTWTGEPVFEFGPPIALPDQQGVPFSSSISFTQFAPGQTVQNVNDIVSICANMEHSYMGDLVISITCPNGQTSVMHQQGGNGTYLGAANDADNSQNPVLGTCWQYCWSASATNGTFAQSVQAGGNVTTAGNPPNNALNPGTYSSVQPLSNLIGCPLNGQWTITFNDLLGIDNGFACDWGLSFDADLYPDLTVFTPVPGTSADSASWTGPFLTTPDTNTPLVATSAPTGPGDYDYTLTVIDNFGCQYDTTVTVTIAPPIQLDAGPDIVLCNDPVPMAGVLLANNAPENCVYLLTLLDSGNNGWGGGLFGTTASVSISVNGVSNTYTIAAGGVATFNIPVTPGAAITISYVVGTNNNQNSFTLRNDQNGVVYQAPPGPSGGLLYSGIATCNGQMAPTQTVWSPTTGLNNPNSLTTPVYTTTPTWYFLSAFPVGHPECAVTDSVLVSPDPSIDAGEFNSITICAGQGSFLLTDSLNGTPDAGGVWTDAAGTVIPSTFDPHTGAAGTYTYTVTSVAGCVIAEDLEIIILAADAPQCCGEADAGEPAFSCTLSIALNAAPGNTGVGLWSGPSGATFADASDPQTTVTMPAGSGGTHWFYWIENDGNLCLLVDSVQMTFTDPLQINFTVNSAVCFSYCDGDATASVTGGSPGALSYAWSNGENGIDLNTIDELCAGPYSLTVADGNACSATASFTISQPPLLELDQIEMIPETCFGTCDGSLLVIDAQALEYSFDGGTNWVSEPLLENLCVGTFDLLIRDAAECIGTASVAVTGPPRVVADFVWTPNPTDINAPSIQFFNASSGANSFEWDITGVADPITIDAQYRFSDLEPGIYPVCLIAYNSNNCSDTVCYDIVIGDVLYVYVPNSFTPDGDGMNDLFSVSTTVELREFSMLIFDRWGQVVYETTDQIQAWNGGYKNASEPLPQGVYAYRIQYGLPESSERKELLGSITLLK